MPEKRDFNVGLNARGLEKDVSEEQARRICSTQGQHSLFIVDAHHGPYVTGEDGAIKMSLIIDSAELIPEAHVDRVQRFMRALYLARPDQYGQEAFETGGDDEPKVEDTARELDSMVEEGPDGEPVGVWSGDDDGEPVPETAAEPENVAGCPHPGCILPEEHDGDHVPHPDAVSTPAEFSNA